MTQPPRENEDAVVAEDLLDEVLREGMTSSGSGDAAAEIRRYHKLLAVLFNQCVLRPPDEVNQTSLERINLTLLILSQQSAQHPELLLSRAASDQSPFYAFLLSRLVIGATHAQLAVTPRRDLVDAFCKAAVQILRTMAHDVSDQGDTFMRGPPRVAHTLREMVRYVRGG